MKLLKGIIKTARPVQWAKNGFVFAALFFTKQFLDPVAVAKTIGAVAAFCMMASSIYFLNDVMDYEEDRKHPKKKFRPIAADILPKPLALLISMGLAVTALAISLVVSPYFTMVLLLYGTLNLFYSLGLKHIAIIDIIIVAFGFMLRAIGGAVAIDASVSAWLIVCTLMLTLFMTTAKRRLEIVRVEKAGKKGRTVLQKYSQAFLNQLISVTVGGVLISYSLFTVYSKHSVYLTLTIPLVFLGMFRYLMLIFREGEGEDPTMLVVKDPPLIIIMGTWVVMTGVILTFFY